MSDQPHTIAEDMVIGMHYTLRFDNGQVIDTSEGQDALEFLQGSGQIIPGLERALYGMAIGDEKEVEVAPADGYGEHDPDAMHQIPRDMVPDDVDLSPGMGVDLRDEAGNIVNAFVADIQPDAVLLDFNHPLAGETLFFQVKIESIRPATSDEIAHGHAHGAGHPH